jgi:hypothetical protein
MNQINSRLVYKTALRAMVRAGVNPDQAILSQSYLRLEVVAATNRTNYQFGVLVNDAPQGNQPRQNENRLNLQDAFYVGSVGIYTALASSATATDYEYNTYPNRFKYTTAGAATALNNFYQGVMSLTVNNRVITPSWSVMRHLNVPQTQQANALGVGVPLDQFDGSEYAQFPCEPNWVLIGSKNNQLQIQLPAAIGTLQAGATNILAIELRGILAQNVTVVS